MSESAVLDAGVQRGAMAAPVDRRSHRRLAPDDVPWIREVRLHRGPRIDLLDIGQGGALLEAPVQLKPGANHLLEIAGPRVETIPIRVVRCQIAAIANGGLRYRGGCEFKQLFDVTATLRAGGVPGRELLKHPGLSQTEAATSTGWQKIVVRYREGRLLKGFTHDFHPSRAQFSLRPTVHAAPAECIHIPLSHLKAVFFVRDFDGNPHRMKSKTFTRPLSGRRIEVTFVDDEVLLGATLSYRPDRLGFFVIPADHSANNQRVFVVAGAIRHIRFP